MLDSVKIFSALADPVRAKITALLCDREMSVSDIVSVFQMGQSRISRHLRILSDAQILKPRRDGLWVRYSITQDGKINKLLLSLKSWLPDVESYIKRLNKLHNKQKYNTKMLFNRVAKRWGYFRKTFLGTKDLTDTILSILPECRIAADLGCGTGDFLPILNKKAKFVIGVDASQSMLNAARQKFGNGFDLRLGELEHLPLANNEVELCLCMFVLHYLPEPGEGIKEIWRVLKPKGNLFLVELKSHKDQELVSSLKVIHSGFSVEYMLDLLKKSGFSACALKSVNIRRNLFAQIYKAKKIKE